MRRSRKLVSSIWCLVSGIRGQSMIEVLIAVGVTAALAVSLITTTLITQKTARSARNNSQATKLAQEYIEQVRILRDRKSFDYISSKVGDCWMLTSADPNPDNWNLDPCPQGIDGEVKILDNTTFIRKVDIDNSAGANKKLITSLVTWQEGSDTKIVSSKTFLSSWCTGGVVPGSPCPSP